MITLVDPIGPGLQAALGTALSPALNWIALAAVVGIAVVAALVVGAELASRPQRRSVAMVAGSQRAPRPWSLGGYAFGKPRQVVAPSVPHGSR
jgi:hypothetical protein